MIGTYEGLLVEMKEQISEESGFGRKLGRARVHVSDHLFNSLKLIITLTFKTNIKLEENEMFIRKFGVEWIINRDKK